MSNEPLSPCEARGHKFRQYDRRNWLGERFGVKVRCERCWASPDEVKDAQ